MSKPKQKSQIVGTERSRRSLLETVPPMRDQWAPALSGRPKKIRSFLLLGTALGAGILSGMLVTVEPAAAACLPAGAGAVVCTGDQPAGIGPYLAPPVFTINIQNAIVADNAAGDGVTHIGVAPGVTLTVNSDAATTIGVAPGHQVVRDGIHQQSAFANTTLVVNSASTIGSAAQPIGRDGIYSRINTTGAGNATVLITTTGGSITANGFGINAFARVATPAPVDPTVAVTVVNAAPITNGDGPSIFARGVSISGLNRTSNANSSVTNSLALTSTNGRGISASTDASAFGPASRARAVTTITNTGAVNSRYVGLYGEAVASTDTLGATAGNSTAGVTISNTNTIVARQGLGIDGASIALARSRATLPVLTATGGVAAATTSIANSGTINSRYTSIYGLAIAYANAYGFFLPLGAGTGGAATGSVVITNTGDVTSADRAGIFGLTDASATGSGLVGRGSTATGTTTITNSGIIASRNNGVTGLAYAGADGLGSNAVNGSGTGGTATSGVVITNTGDVTSADRAGINGTARSSATGSGFVARGGTATANAGTAAAPIYNSGTIASNLDGVYGLAIAAAGGYGSFAANGSGTGGSARAGVVIINTGNVTSAIGDGIDGRADAFARGQGFTAVGGLATGATTISNSGAITSGNNGVEGTALANADAVSSNAVGSTARGNTSNATVTITNIGDIKALNFGILGSTNARANASGHVATGGAATASTTINNSGNINSVYFSGISGVAAASADGFGFSGASSGAGTGGRSNAGVVITNTGNVNSGAGSETYGNAIQGLSFASASGSGRTGTGANATATTTIGSSGRLHSYYDNGIVGDSYALAGGFGSFNSANGRGTGGTAVAGVTITNAGAILAPYGNGILGNSLANASGSGFVAQGGSATATTTINNTGTIRSDAGIAGYSTALADGIGSFGLIGFVPGSGTGGTAVASVTITNSGNITAAGPYADGIIGGSVALARGFGRNAVGRTATATTTIVNSGRIRSDYDGIDAFALADASAFGTFSIFDPAAGGTANATVTITNAGPINSAVAHGIIGNSTAYANGIGVGGAGGTATATTTIDNSGRIAVHGNSEGIDAESYAFAIGTYTGGRALATTTVNNNAPGMITTFGNYAHGIQAISQANASGYYGTGLTTYAGYARAETTVTNSGVIKTGGNYAAGIAAYSAAFATGYTSAAANSGTAIAITTVTNSGAIATAGNYSPAIYATSFAVAGTYTTGSAQATTTVNNSGTLFTAGYASPAIFASSGAYAGGNTTATAATNVTNSGGITTVGSFSSGIVAISNAGGYYAGYYGALSSAGTAVATTTVTNSGTIRTFGAFSPGIFAASFASGYYGATATTSVANSGTIRTYGFGSAGVIASASSLTDATATTTVANSGTIQTSGPLSPGVVASSLAFDLLTNATATTVIDNTGTILTTGIFSPGVVALADAISFPGTSTATITVNNSGVIQTSGPASDAINAAVTFGSATSAITVNNTATGSIIASGSPYHAVVASGAPTTINNAGLVRGNVVLSAFADTFNNSGQWVMQGNSDFGAGADAVNNSGTVSMIKAGSTLTAATVPPIAGQNFFTVTMAGLENFNNTGGLITMIDGQPNDQIVLSGNFNGSGNSRLGADAFLGPVGSTADILSVNGNVTGTTHILVNDTNPGLGAFNPVGIPVVIAGGTTNPTNFDLPQGPIDKGFFSYDLFLRPDKVWVLASEPNQRAHELPRLVSAAENIWHQAAGMWLDRTADLRSQFHDGYVAGTACDPRIIRKDPCVTPNVYGGGPGMWMRAFGDVSRSDGTATSTTFGRTRSFDVKYNQSVHGFQGGVDFATTRTGYTTFMAGLLAGYVASNVDFASPSRATFSGGNVGAYATFLNGGFFADGLVMANFTDMSFRSGLLPNIDTNVLTFGGHLDVGYRFKMPGGYFAEPLASLEYVKATFDNLAVPGTSIALDGDSIRGRLGARFGTTFVSGSMKLEPSVTLSVWHAFEGDNIASLSSGGFVVDLADVNLNKTYGEIGGALNIFELGSQWSGFVKADFRFGDNLQGGSGKGGVRYQW